jgi:hypothetical protein
LPLLWTSSVLRRTTAFAASLMLFLDMWVDFPCG